MLWEKRQLAIFEKLSDANPPGFLGDFEGFMAVKQRFCYVVKRVYFQVYIATRITLRISHLP